MSRYFLFYLIFISNYFRSQNITTHYIDSAFSSVNKIQHYNEFGAEKFKVLYYQSKGIGYDYGVLICLKKLTDIYASSSNYSLAIDYIQETKDLSLKTGNYMWLAGAYTTESKIYLADNHLEAAFKSIELGSKYLNKINDIEQRRSASTSLAIHKWFIFKKSKLHIRSYKDSLLSVSRQVFSEGKLMQNSSLRTGRMIFGAVYSAKVLIQMGKRKEAEFYLKQADELSQKEGAGDFFVVDYYVCKGDYELAGDADDASRLDRALEFYNIALKKAKAVDYSGAEPEIYKQLAKIYKEKKDVENESYYLKKEIGTSEWLMSKSQANLSATKSKLYIKKSDERSGTSNYVFIVLFVLGLLLVGVLWRRKAIARFFGNRFVKETVVVADTEESSGVNKVKFDELVECLVNDSDGFYVLFLQSFPNFSDNLLEINDKLKSSDIEFCALIIMQLDTKRIAQIKNVTVRAVESKKYRIRKKLNIPPDADIYLWLSTKIFN